MDLVQALTSSDIGVCVKGCPTDTEGTGLASTVRYQNEACIAICGDWQGERCAGGCMGLLPDVPSCPTLLQGAHLKQIADMAGEAMDVVLVNDPAGDLLVTLLIPAGHRGERIRADVAGYGLSRQETEVIVSVASGQSRAEICRRLCVSKPTLKTHLNNAYRKLPRDLRAALKGRVVSRGKIHPLG